MNVQSVSEHVTLIDAPYHGMTGVLSTYLVRGSPSIIVDPGPTESIPSLITALRQMKAQELVYITPTHIHLDHAGGTWKLMGHFNKSKLLVHPKGAKHMIDPTKLEAGARSLFGEAVTSYGEIRGVPKKKIEKSRDDQTIDLDGVTIKIVWTPGHASHHQCIYVPEDKTLILGDAGGIYDPDTNITLPTSPPPFNPSKATESLDKLIRLKPKTLCYGHYGSTGNAIKRLENHRQQIELWSKVVSDALEENLKNEEIYNLIAEQDPMTSKIPYTSEKSERSPAINILGFKKFHEWKKS
jgi:glyoxylase-like metal-dependent hydrolase (beta-lactamase superfamily II)